MNRVVRTNFAMQILWDFYTGVVDITPPKLKQGKDILRENDGFLEEVDTYPFLYEEQLYEGE